MTKRLTITTRLTDYKSAAEATAAFLAGKDFTSCGMHSYGLAVNLEDCQADGITDVTIRYKKSTMSTNVTVPAA